MKQSKYLIIGLVILGTLPGIVSADFDPNQVVASVQEFLIRQMEVFDSVRPLSQPPLVQTFAWAPGLAFPPAELDPVPCCALRCALPPLSEMAYRGDIYDQSLAAIWFTERARIEFEKGGDGTENFNRARRLLDAVIFLRDHDPIGDGRIRTAYWANNLLNLAGTEASIMDPSVGVGNMAYFGIALTRFYHVAELTGYLDDPNRQQYLTAAEEAGDWIIDHCSDHNWSCGFTGGYEGWGPQPNKFTWKSTEHNIDVFVFANNLCHLTRNRKWNEMAESAACLVRAMYVEVDANCGYYQTGTLADGQTPNPSQIPADAQTWTTLARCGGVKIDTDERAEHAMCWLLENLKDRCQCDSISLPDDGVKFTNIGKNVQCEATASAALALLWIGRETPQAQRFLELLDWIRVNAAPPGDGIEDGNGIIATPCPEGAWTGFGEYAWYYNLLHVASSTWTGSACLYLMGEYETANPLMPISCNRAPIADAGEDQSYPAGTDCTAEVPLDGSDSNDPDGDDLTYTWSWTINGNEFTVFTVAPTIELPVGEHSVRLVVNDGCRDSEPNYVVITVEDNTVPELTVSVMPEILWPPNHKMVMIVPTIIVSDNCDDSPEVSLIGITVNEGDRANTFEPGHDNRPRGGDPKDDIQIGDDGSISLRAERSGTSNGRVYTLTYQAVDNSGNVVTGTATVTVPHHKL